jgi:phosphoenolpyruvate carboxylase
MKINVPVCMSTQHPDNVKIPFFSDNSVLDGENEIKEAYYAFSHLGCTEQMWDSEGKEVDNFVVKKLLTKYGQFFQENVLGKDVFITLRIPNPSVEKSEAKVMLETLESIPRSFDAAKLFYKHDAAPIFEVILPMTSSDRELNRVYHYYRNFVVGKENKRFFGEDVRISEWIGSFKPEKINVIPLIEDIKHLLNAHKIVEGYLKGKKLEHQRVFLARSDPPLNYGLISGVLVNKAALQNLHRLEEKTSIELLPIIGKGSAPFRGGLKPDTVELVMKEYPSVQTYTIQSAFKYDYTEKEIVNAIEKLNSKKRGNPDFFDEERIVEIVDRYSKEYRRQVADLAPLINRISGHIPSRRKRKLHIGLWGYPREMGTVKLPRAIKFCAALYSIGIPPELLGLNALDGKDMEFVMDVYRKFISDLKDALKYLNEANFTAMLPDGRHILERVKDISVDIDIDAEHRESVKRIIKSLGRNDTESLREDILKAGQIRRFLG